MKLTPELEVDIRYAVNPLYEDQHRTIEALNACIGGEGSTTTENITRIAELERDLQICERIKNDGWIKYNELKVDADIEISRLRGELGKIVYSGDAASSSIAREALKNA